jgi:hypothetical protein
MRAFFLATILLSIAAQRCTVGADAKVIDVNSPEKRDLYVGQYGRITEWIPENCCGGSGCYKMNFDNNNVPDGKTFCEYHVQCKEVEILDDPLGSLFKQGDYVKVDGISSVIRSTMNVKVPSNHTQFLTVGLDPTAVHATKSALDVFTIQL